MNRHFIKQNRGATTPSCDLARNASEVSVTVVSKHCAGIIRTHREPPRRTADQFSDEKSYSISADTILFIYCCTPLPAIVGNNECGIQKLQGSS